MKSSLPPGLYLARLVRRKSIPQNQGGGIDYTFSVDRGEYMGEIVSTRLWAPGKIQRADGIMRSDTVEIVVANRRTATGQGFATVHEFRRVSALTAVDAVRGRDMAANPATAADAGLARGTFEPHPLVVGCEETLWEVLGDEVELKFPLIDDDLAKQVIAAARPTNSTLPDGMDNAVPPDDCDFWDFDDEVIEYCCGIARTGDGMPTPVTRATEENSPPLPVAPNGVQGPMWCSPFLYTGDLESYAAAHQGSVRDYSGLAWSHWLPIRMLAEGQFAGVVTRMRQVVTACVGLGVPPGQLIVINNWNFGLSLLIPSGAANAAPQLGYEKVAGHFAQVLVDLAFSQSFNPLSRLLHHGIVVPANPQLHVPIDRQLYGPAAIHPLINSPDRSGQLFAVALTCRELLSLEVRDLEELAKAPRVVPTPPWQSSPVKAISELWKYAVSGESMRSRRADSVYEDHSQFVHADTFDWMLHGSDGESSQKRLFRAALNLLRLGCSRNAVIALLLPAAHLSYLDRESVAWGVDCAAKKLLAEGFGIAGLRDLEN